MTLFAWLCYSRGKESFQWKQSFRNFLSYEAETSSSSSVRSKLVQLFGWKKVWFRDQDLLRRKIQTVFNKCCRPEYFFVNSFQRNLLANQSEQKESKVNGWGLPKISLVLKLFKPSCYEPRSTPLRCSSSEKLKHVLPICESFKKHVISSWINLN